MRYRIVEQCVKGNVTFYVEEEKEVGFWIFKELAWKCLESNWGGLRRFDSYASAKSHVESLHPQKSYTKIVEYIEV